MAKVIPFKDRILCKRRVIGEKVGKEGLIYMPDTAAERPTDLADVIYVPDLTFTDKQLLDASVTIVDAMSRKATQGEPDALKMLLEFNEFLKIKSIKPGDAVMIGKYVGTDFYTTEGENLTLVAGSDIIGLIVKEKKDG